MNDLKLPPHSIEAEQAVLGGIMLNNNVWDDVVDILSESDFYRNEHKLIWRHIDRLFSMNIPVDVLTVSDSISSTGKLEIIGGLGYVGGIVNGTPSASNVKHYAKLIKDKSKARKLIEVSYEIGRIAFSEGDPQKNIETVSELISSITENENKGVVKASEAAQKALELLEHRFASSGDIHGLKTGLKDFDAKTGGLQNGDLIIIAGRPSMGKTAFAMNIAENVAMSGKSVFISSLEMSEIQLAIRNISSSGQICLWRLMSGRLNDDDWDRLTKSLGKIHNAMMFIDASPNVSVQQIHARARKIKRKEGLNLVVIDYLQLMGEGNENRNNELSNITRRLKLMARDLNCPVICLSQLSRKVEERGDKRPMLSDLRDSGAIEQDADVVVMMYREEYYNKETLNKGLAEAIIAKQRMGPIGTVLLTFQGEYSRFTDFNGEYHKSEKKQNRGFVSGKQLAGGQ